MRYLAMILAFASLPVFATGPTAKTQVAPGGSATVSNSSSTNAVGLGSGSPSANACQGIAFFGFSYDVKTCQLQQWAAILGRNPTDIQIQLACKDELLKDLPLCVVPK